MYTVCVQSCPTASTCLYVSDNIHPITHRDQRDVEEMVELQRETSRLHDECVRAPGGGSSTTLERGLGGGGAGTDECALGLDVAAHVPILPEATPTQPTTTTLHVSSTEQQRLLLRLQLLARSQDWLGMRVSAALSTAL